MGEVNRNDMNKEKAIEELIDFSQLLRKESPIYQAISLAVEELKNKYIYNDVIAPYMCNMFGLTCLHSNPNGHCTLSACMRNITVNTENGVAYIKE